MSWADDRSVDFTVDAVHWRRKKYFENGYRPFAVWSPGAADQNGEPIRNAGKRAKGGDWRNRALEDVPWAVRLRPDSDALNTGFLTDLLPAIDVDVLRPELVDRIVAMIEQLVGVTPLVRQGQAPKVALLYRSPEPFHRLATAKLQFADGEKPTVVEIMGEGQSILADGVHPATLAPYRWFAETPLTIRWEELPVLTAEAALTIISEAEKILRLAGAGAWIGPNARSETEPRVPARANRGPGGEGDNFFHNVNTRALRQAEDWVPLIWPIKRPAQNGAWRVTAQMRGLPASKQDLSIHPDGICDFHSGETLTPIDVVLEYGVQTDVIEAALWLCARLGVEPGQLGWRERKPTRGGDGAPPGGEEPPAGPEPEGPTPERVIWVYGGLRHIAAQEGIVAMHEARVPFFRRDWQLMRVCPRPIKRIDGSTVEILDMLAVEEPILEMALATSAKWQKINSKGAIIRIDPDAVVPLVMKLHTHWRFPPLHGIVRTPTLRPDGTLLSQPGYDRKTGIWLALDQDFAMPAMAQNPTRGDALAALELFRGLLSGFPFVDEASFAVALSLMITPVVRVAMPVAPLHLVTAPAPGTGKSFLIDVASAIATGEPASVIAMPPREEELEKRLIGAALGSRPMIVLDNVRRVVESDFLCQLAERKVLELRPLGTSQKVDVVNAFLTVIDGNNLAVADDLVRRSVRCALDANMPNPEQRQFAFDPLTRVRAERGRYIAAALTIVRAYLAAGSPDQCPSYGSYEVWSARVRSALVWLGCADPAATILALRDDDPDRQALGLVYSAWAGIGELMLHQEGWTTAELVALADSYPLLREALLTVAPGRGAEAGKPDRTKLGNWLKRRVNRIAEGVKLVVNRVDRNRPRWRLVPAYDESAGAAERGFGPHEPTPGG